MSRVIRLVAAIGLLVLAATLDPATWLWIGLLSFAVSILLFASLVSEDSRFAHRAHAADQARQLAREREKVEREVLDAQWHIEHDVGEVAVDVPERPDVWRSGY